jgi:hypothetical protein
MLNTKIERQGAIVDQHMKVFHIETALNNRMFGSATDFLGRNEDEFSEFDRMKYEAMRFGLSKLPTAAKRKIFQAIPAEYELIACYAGKTEPVHDAHPGQAQRPVHGQPQGPERHRHLPHSLRLSVQHQLDPEPHPGSGHGHGLFPQLLSGQARAAQGWGGDPVPPLPRRIRSQVPPELHRVLQPPAARDARRAQVAHKYEEEFAHNPSYIEMYRRGNAYHGAHPFFMWYWGENGRNHVGKVIVAGAQNAHVPARMGWDAPSR